MSRCFQKTLFNYLRFPVAPTTGPIQIMTQNCVTSECFIRNLDVADVATPQGPSSHFTTCVLEKVGQFLGMDSKSTQRVNIVQFFLLQH